MKITGRALALVLTAVISFAQVAPAFALGELPPVETPLAPPAVDICPNIGGSQVSVPSGLILDGSGNCVTPPSADATAPIISGVVDQSVLSTTATIVWLTNELSVSTFEYGTTQSYGSSASISASLAMGGTAVLTGLTPGITHYYCIHAHDASNNASQSCGSFTTAAAADRTGPLISGIVNATLLPT